MPISGDESICEENENLSAKKIVNTEMENTDDVTENGLFKDKIGGFFKREKAEDMAINVSDDKQDNTENYHNDFINELKKNNDTEPKLSDATYKSNPQKMDHGQIEKEIEVPEGIMEKANSDISEINNQDNGKDIEAIVNEKNYESELSEKTDMKNIEDSYKEYNSLSNRVSQAVEGIQGHDFEKEENDPVKTRYGTEMLKKAEEQGKEIDRLDDKMNKLHEKIINAKDSTELPQEEKNKMISNWQKEFNKCLNERNERINLLNEYEKSGNDLLKDVKEKTDFVGVGKRDFLEMDESLIQDQGKAVKGFGGTCGCCSTANSMNLLGEKISEKEVVEYARANGLCLDTEIRDDYSEKLKDKIERDNGGTTWEQREEILNHFGYDCKTVRNQNIDDIYEQIKDNKSVILSINDVALKKDNTELLKRRNHCVTVKGIEIGTDGKPKGLWVHDTSGGTSRMGRSAYISAGEFRVMSIQSDQAVQYVSPKKK